MPNPKYLKGVRKERKIVNEARAKGLIALRSAGSHSPIDVVVIDPVNKKISLIQCKSDSMNEHQKQKLRNENKLLNGVFEVSFSVV